ncbi:MAG: hypothetical protein LUE96_00865 [Lachnospiraceae bacterium]|nr:hypothetical protein [Lachnospiraceae bacterium]
MGVTGISSTVSDAYAAVTTEASAAAETSAASEASNAAETESTSTSTTAATEAAVYDKTTLSEDDRKTIVDQLKADLEKREAQLTSLVQDMLSKQTNAFGAANNIWRFLASGNYTVDEETQKKAQEDISEDGYWGVEQTSDRIVSFATALAGNDADALEEMREAFLKGYEQAEDAWGGELPEISQKTYDAVLEKIYSLLESMRGSTVTSTEDGTVISK